MGLSLQKKKMSPVLISLFSFLGMMFWGFIISLITSAFLKKEGDAYQNAMQDIEEE